MPNSVKKPIERAKKCKKSQLLRVSGEIHGLYVRFLRGAPLLSVGAGGAENERGVPHPLWFSIVRVLTFRPVSSF